MVVIVVLDDKNTVGVQGKGASKERVGVLVRAALEGHPYLPTTRSHRSLWNFFKLLSLISQLNEAQVKGKDNDRILELEGKVKAVLSQIYGRFQHTREDEEWEGASVGSGEVTAAEEVKEGSSTASLSDLCLEALDMLWDLLKNNSNPCGMAPLILSMKDYLVFIAQATGSPFCEYKIERFEKYANKKLVKKPSAMMAAAAPLSVSVNTLPPCLQTVSNQLIKKMRIQTTNQHWVNTGLQISIVVAIYVLYQVVDDSQRQSFGLKDSVLSDIESWLFNHFRALTSTPSLAIPEVMLEVQGASSAIQLLMLYCQNKLSMPICRLDAELWCRMLSDFFALTSRAFHSVGSGLGVTLKSTDLVWRILKDLSQEMSRGQFSSSANLYLGIQPMSPVSIGEFNEGLSCEETNIFPTYQGLLVGFMISLAACYAMHAYDMSWLMYMGYFVLTAPLAATFKHLYVEIAGLLWMAGCKAARFTVISSLLVAIAASIWPKQMIEVPGLSELLRLFISLSPINNPDLYEIGGLNLFIGFMVGIVYSQFAVVLSTIPQAFCGQGMFLSVMRDLMKNPALYAVMFMVCSRLSMFYCKQIESHILDECEEKSTAKAFMGILTLFTTIVFFLKEVGAVLAALVSQKSQRMSLFFEQMIFACATTPVHIVQAFKLGAGGLIGALCPISSSHPDADTLQVAFLGDDASPADLTFTSEIQRGSLTTLTLFTQPGMALAQLMADFVRIVVFEPTQMAQLLCDLISLLLRCVPACLKDVIANLSNSITNSGCYTISSEFWTQLNARLKTRVLPLSKSSQPDGNFCSFWPPCRDEAGTAEAAAPAPST